MRGFLMALAAGVGGVTGLFFIFINADTGVDQSIKMVLGGIFVVCLLVLFSGRNDVEIGHITLEGRCD